MKKFKSIGVVALAALLFSSADAAAQSLRVDLDMAATGSVDLLNRSSTSTRAGSATPNASGSARENANVNSRINVGSSSIQTSSSGSFNTINGNSTRTSATSTFSITRSDIAQATSTSADPADVSSEADFESYAKAVMASDENVVRIDSNDKSVSVWYREPARFLGIIPVMVSVRAEARASGEVVVTYPWWYSLFVKEEGSTNLQNNLSTTAGAIARSEGETELSSSAQARLVNALHAGMREYHNATIVTGTSTEMTTQ